MQAALHFLDVLEFIETRMDALHAVFRNEQHVDDDTPRESNRLSENSVLYYAMQGQVQHNMYKHGNLVRIGPNNQRFVLRFSQASKSSVYMYKDALSYLARVRGRHTGERLRIQDYADAADYFTIEVGEHFLAMNSFSQTMQGKNGRR